MLLKETEFSLYISLKKLIRAWPTNNTYANEAFSLSQHQTPQRSANPLAGGSSAYATPEQANENCSSEQSPNLRGRQLRPGGETKYGRAVPGFDNTFLFFY